MADVRIVSGGQNEGPITAVSVRALPRANPLLVSLVNISGDIYNAGGGGGGVGSDINVSQVGGIATAVNVGNANNGTLRVIVASDQPSIPVSGNFTATTTPPPVTGVQIVGGSVGAQVSPSGDFPVRLAAVTVGLGITGDVSTKPATGQTWPVREQGIIGVNVVGAGVVQAISGDVRQNGAWATAITGDVLLRAGGPTMPVAQQVPIGVQVIGGSVGGQFSASGDLSTKPAAGQTWPVREQAVLGVTLVGSTIALGASGDVGAIQRGAYATAITGDVLLRANPSTIIGQLAGTLGVTIIGGSVGARISASGDLNVVPSTTNSNRFPVSGDTGLSDGVNRAILVTVKNYLRSNPVAVALVNASGDVYNASPGASSGGDGAILDGSNSAVRATVLSGPTTRPDANSNPQVVQLADDPTRQIGLITPPVTGVQIVGGGNARVSISGDSLNIGAVNVGIGVTGDVSTKPAGGQVWPVREQNVTGIYIVGSNIVQAVSGDVRATQVGGWATSITGDVLLRAGQPTLTVAHQGPIGVNVIGGSIGAQVSPSGDFPIRISSSTTPLGVSGDVSTKPAAGQTWPVREQNVIGVYVVGGTGQPASGISGDVAIKPSTTSNIGRFPVSGDIGLSDGANRAILTTVKNYTRANPVAVVLVNSSGDAYNSATDNPNVLVVAGRVSAAGSNQIVAAVSGKRIKVLSYDLQGDGDNSRGYFASNPSGSQLTLEWELASREGVAKQIPPVGDSFIFGTLAGQSLSFESSSSKAIKYAISYHADDDK